MIKSIAVLLFCAMAVAPGRAGESRSETIEGYAEWKGEDVIYVDGQRVVAGTDTKFKGQGIRSLADIPLGHEVKVKGRRHAGGEVNAREIEVRPNGIAWFEPEVLQATNDMERLWLSDGHMFEPGADGSRSRIGRIIESGPRVDRVRGIVRRMVPPYVKPEDVRVYVVDTEQWNAAAMGNGAIWVFSGLIDQLSDDDLAIILGHELAHYTHEHTRRNQRRGFMGQLAGIGAQTALAHVDNPGARHTAEMATAIGITAWLSGYSRNLEDQADRVGLRYAFEAGFDVSVGPGLWAKFRERYGETNELENFLRGTHSRPSDRMRNLTLEIERNYGPQAERYSGSH
jgi:Zn-dependent protease with chaperone function